MSAPDMRIPPALAAVDGTPDPDYADGFIELDPATGEVREVEGDGTPDAGREPDESMVLKRWIIVHRDQWAPEKKVPRNTDEGVSAMLRDLHHLYPFATTYVVRLVYGNDLWVDSGSGWLALEDSARRAAPAVVESTPDPCP